MSLIQSIKAFLKLRLKYKDLNREHYYRSIFTTEHIKETHNHLHRRYIHNYETQNTITFGGLNMQSPFYEFVNHYGTPYLKKSIKYIDQKHTVAIYNHKLIDQKVKIALNAIDNTIVSCRYHIETVSPKYMDKVLTAICSKYQIEIDRELKEFTINDKEGNRIVVSTGFETTITYLSGAKEVKQKVNSILGNIDYIKLRQHNKQVAELKMAF